MGGWDGWLVPVRDGWSDGTVENLATEPGSSPILSLLSGPDRLRTERIMRTDSFPLLLGSSLQDPQAVSDNAEAVVVMVVMGEFWRAAAVVTHSLPPHPCPCCPSPPPHHTCHHLFLPTPSPCLSCTTPTLTFITAAFLSVINLCTLSAAPAHICIYIFLLPKHIHIISFGQFVVSGWDRISPHIWIGTPHAFSIFPNMLFPFCMLSFPYLHTHHYPTPPPHLLHTPTFPTIIPSLFSTCNYPTIPY